MRQNLDSWDRYSKYTDRTYFSVGQNIARASQLVTPVTAGVDTLGVGATGLVTGTAAGSLANQAIAIGDKIQIQGHEFYAQAAIAAGVTIIGLQLSPAPQAAITATLAGQTGALRLSSQGMEYQTKRWAPTLDTINIAAHGIDIYKQFPANFFNQYTAYHYGGPNINAPKDVGSLFIPFCLYPGTYQPSGHINISRAREFYLTYGATTFDPTNNPVVSGLLVVIASAINFLLISDKHSVRAIEKTIASHQALSKAYGKTFKLRETPQLVNYQVDSASCSWRLGNQAGTVKRLTNGQSAAKLLYIQKKVQRLNVSWSCDISCAA